MLAVQADGASITTVEGLAGDDGEHTPLQRAFHEHHALQCGYCTPGMLMSATALLEQNPRPTRARGQGRPPGQHLPLHGLLEHRRGGRRRRRGRRAMTAIETEVGHPPEGRGVGPEHSAEGGQAARPGPGRLRRRHQAQGNGLPPLRPLAVRAREDRVDRRLGRARAARGLRHADRRRGRDPDRPVLPDRRTARRPREGLRARRRQGALPRRARRGRRRRDPRARARRRRARDGRVRAARRRRRRAGRSRRRGSRAARGMRRQPLLLRRLGVGRRRRRVRRGGPHRQDRRAPLRPLQLDAARVRRSARRVQPRHRPVDDVHEQPVPRASPRS